MTRTKPILSLRDLASRLGVPLEQLRAVAQGCKPAWNYDQVLGVMGAQI